MLWAEQLLAGWQRPQHLQLYRTEFLPTKIVPNAGFGKTPVRVCDACYEQPDNESPHRNAPVLTPTGLKRRTSSFNTAERILSFKEVTPAEFQGNASSPVLSLQSLVSRPSIIYQEMYEEKPTRLSEIKK